MVVRVWQPAGDRVVFRAGAADRENPAPPESVELAIERMRFALGVDDDLTEFARTFRGDPLLGAIIRHRPWLRPRRRPWAWEALAWAVTEQLIESCRAAEIQRRIVRRWGGKLMPPASSAADPGAAASNAAWLGPGPLRDVPSAELIAGAPRPSSPRWTWPPRAPWRSSVRPRGRPGRVDPGDPADDRRLLRISEIGPWTLQVPRPLRPRRTRLAARRRPRLREAGRPLVGLGRRATVEEVEEFFAPYAPFRGLAGSFALARWHGSVAAGPPLRLAA